MVPKLVLDIHINHNLAVRTRICYLCFGLFLFICQKSKEDNTNKGKLIHQYWCRVYNFYKINSKKAL